MADQTQIEWTDATWNPIVGCSIVSKGCTNCYAMKVAGARLDGNPNTPHYAGTTTKTKAGPVWTGKVALAPEATLLKPLSWKKPRRIFVNSMGDLFAEGVPDEWIDKVFAVMAIASQHVFQVLTKRPDRMRDYARSRFGGPGELWLEGAIAAIAGSNSDVGGVPDEPLSNVHLGVSVEDQATANERIPILLDTPAAVRWISAEPLLSRVDLSNWFNDRKRKSIFGPSGAWPFQGRSRRNLAAGQVDWRRGSSEPDLYPALSRGDEFGGKGELSPGDVQGREFTSSSLRSSDHLDGCEPPSDPARDGGEPYRRQQDQQHAGQPRTRHASTECTAQSHASETEKERSAGGQEFVGSFDGRSSAENTRNLGSKSDEPARDIGTLRREAADGFERDNASDLEASSLDWVVVGGESGPDSRPMHPDWARALRDQCEAAGVPFHFKQWGDWVEVDDDTPAVPLVRCLSATPHPVAASEARTAFMARVGKTRAGRTLDGRLHDGRPRGTE
jgi:protein gp37